MSSRHRLRRCDHAATVPARPGHRSDHQPDVGRIQPGERLPQINRHTRADTRGDRQHTALTIRARQLAPTQRSRGGSPVDHRKNPVADQPTAHPDELANELGALKPATMCN